MSHLNASGLVAGGFVASGLGAPASSMRFRRSGAATGLFGLRMHTVACAPDLSPNSSLHPLEGSLLLRQDALTGP